MFVSVDTVSIDDDKNDAESMKQLLESELAKAGDDEWKIVFGHYPCHSGGGYSGYRSMREQILPTMKAHNVDFYLTGHDHNLQHWRKKDNPADVDHIITGKTKSRSISTVGGSGATCTRNFFELFFQNR